MAPLVSVIVPTYNRAHFIGEAVQSVLSQTYVNLELIVADDGSTDNTSEIVHSIRDPRIHYVVLPHSGLPAAPRNRAIAQSSGEFIAFLDSDDVWCPGKLETCVRYLQSDPTLGLVCSNEYLLNGRSVQSSKTLQPPTSEDRKVKFQDLFLQGNVVSSSTAMVRRKVLLNVGSFAETPMFRAVEDYHLWLRIAAAYPMLYLGEPLGYYRVHDGSIRLDQERSLLGLLSVLEDIKTRYPNLIKPFENHAKKRINGIRYAILKHYVRQREFRKSLAWIFGPTKHDLQGENV